MWWNRLMWKNRKLCKGPFTLWELLLRFVFASNEFNRDWCCHNCIIWTLVLNPVQPISCDKKNRSLNRAVRMGLNSSFTLCVFLWWLLQFFLSQQMGCTGLNESVHTMRLWKSLPTSIMPIKQKTNRSCNPRKTHSVNKPLIVHLYRGTKTICTFFFRFMFDVKLCVSTVLCKKSLEVKKQVKKVHSPGSHSVLLCVLVYYWNTLIREKKSKM